jgi:polar amino acid transport system ATP-binding protein
MMWTPDQPLVRLADVHKTFGGLEVLKGVSMDVMKGEVICIIGPSGSGKSTLLRCVNALVPIDRGSILVEGQEVNDPKLDKLALRRKVGMVFQQYNLFPHKTALENVMMAPVHVLKRDKKEVEAQAHALIDKVRLHGKEHAYPGELSGGQQQRIAIARALLRDAPVLLLDEATSSLDTETERLVQEALDRLSEGRTTIAIAHRLSTVRDADQIVVLDHGRVVEQGRHEDLLLAGGRYTTLAARDAELVGA